MILDNLGLSMTARIYVESAGVGFVAWGILLPGVITLLRDFQYSGPCYRLPAGTAR